MEHGFYYLINFGRELPAFMSLCAVLFLLIGLYWFGTGIAEIQKYNRQGQTTPKQITARVFAGFLLLTLEAFMSMLGFSFFGVESGELHYFTSFTAPPEGTVVSDQIAYVLPTYFAFMGWLAAYKGVRTFNEGARYNEKGYGRTAIGYLIFGLVLLKLPLFIDWAAASAGFTESFGTDYLVPA